MNTQDYQKLIASSVHLCEDNRRLYYNLTKPEHTVIHSYGGSITAGYSNICTYLKAYPQLVLEHLTMKLLPNKHFSLANHSYCCFHTHLGIGLLSEVLNNEIPDICILEYAINNAYELEFASSFEGMIQKILATNPLAAIIIVCTRDEQGYTCENYMADLANYYHLPMISLSSLFDYGKQLQFQWSDYSHDNCHPTQDGQQLLADCILNLLQQTLTCQTLGNVEDFFVPERPCYSDLYQNATFIPANQCLGLTCFAQYEAEKPYINSMIHICGAKEENCVEFSCQRIYLLYEQSGTQKVAGQLLVKVDNDKTPTVIDGTSVFEWDSYASQLIYDGTFGPHKVHLKMSPADYKKSFVLYGFLIL